MAFRADTIASWSQDPLLHHVLSFLPSNDVVRLRGVSAGLRDAVHRLPGGLFVKLSISFPTARTSQRRDPSLACSMPPTHARSAASEDCSRKSLRPASSSQRCMMV